MREREAKRLCEEVTRHETVEKYNKALEDISALRTQISQLEDVEKARGELGAKLEE